MERITLGNYVTGPTEGAIATTPYGGLETFELAEFLAQWTGLQREALVRLGEERRIHPSAFIHPTAIIGDDVIIGPDVKVHEFSTVRKGSILCAGARVGFNCEVTATFVGESAVLGHRIGVNRTILGARTHLSANVTVAAINMTTDMRTPDREVIMRTASGLYRSGTTRFGALIGDDTQTGTNIGIGPGVAIGRRCQITSGVTLAIRTVPNDCTVTAPHSAEATVRRRRRTFAR
ncbi:transferase (plasmid) [Streptomyces sp. NBC_00536]|uniref:transferase n=1 Tax=Streptomyces sp. NBC_00536 TaxID=2975769 RepID=UPI002E823EC6|nr:transferase [Streptomyces sp. NBC_00536]WUC84174.1 transferase [Streptomyces sp. NBC_00536]